MLSCPLYKKLREELWKSVWPHLSPMVIVLSEEEQSSTLLSAENRDLVKITLKFIKQAVQLRRIVENEKEKEKNKKNGD